MTSTESPSDQPAAEPPVPEQPVPVPVPATPATTLRPTRQRLAVIAALDTFTDFRSAQEIHDLLVQRGESVGLATVYRTLVALAEADEIDGLRSEDGETVYRRCSASHHHHLVCRTCGAAVEVEAPEMEVWAGSIATQHGYSDVSHHLEIFGTCPDCH